MPVSLETVYDLRHRWDFDKESGEEIRGLLREEIVAGLKKELQENYEVDGILLKVGDEAFTRNGSQDFIEPAFWYGDTRAAVIFDFMVSLSNIYTRTMEGVPDGAQRAVELFKDKNRYIVLLGVVGKLKEEGRGAAVQKILKVSKNADFKKHAKDFFKWSAYHVSRVQKGKYSPADIGRREYLACCMTPIFNQEEGTLRIGRHRFEYLEDEGFKDNPVRMYEIVSETL